MKSDNTDSYSNTDEDKISIDDSNQIVYSAQPKDDSELHIVHHRVPFPEMDTTIDRSSPFLISTYLGERPILGPIWSDSKDDKMEEDMCSIIRAPEEELEKKKLPDDDDDDSFTESKGGSDDEDYKSSSKRNSDEKRMWEK